MKKTLTVIISVIILFIILIVIRRNEYTKEKNYILELDLKLRGIVDKTVPLKQGHNFGVVNIDLTNSNIENYDKRGKRDKYFGVIKNNELYLAVKNISYFKKGDIYTLDGRNYSIIRNDSLVEENIYGMPYNIFDPYNEIEPIINNMINDSDQ